MVSSRLHGVRRRVEAIHRSLLPPCSGQHRFYRFDDVVSDRELPEWPERGQALVCVCGVPLQFVRIRWAA